MRAARLLLAVAALSAAVLAIGYAPCRADEEGVGGSAFHKNDITYSTEVETPHVKWAAKLPAGAIKGFFIPTVAQGRDMVELMQRIQLEPTTVTIDPNWDTNCWGIGDYYGHKYRGDRNDFATVFGYVEKDLTGEADFEVIVIPDVNGWSRMTRKTRDAIIRRVQDGAGLVLIHPTVGDVESNPFEGDEAEGDIRIWDLSPLVESPSNPINEGGYPMPDKNPARMQGAWEKKAPHFITSGIPIELLPEGATPNYFFKYKANGEVLIASGENPILATRSYGKGRVVALAWDSKGFIPRALDPVETGIYWDYWEYYYSLLSRSVLWAARGEPAATIEHIEAPPAAEPELTMVIKSSQARVVDIEVAAKSEFGGVTLGAWKDSRTLKAGENEIALDLAGSKAVSEEVGGMVIYDVIIRKDQATLDWASAVSLRPKSATITALQTGKEVYRRGDTLTTEFTASGNLDRLTARFRVADELDRVITSQSMPAAESNSFECSLADYIGSYAFVTSELVSAEGLLVDQKRSPGILVVQKRRRPREFKALVSFAGGRPFFRNLRGRLVRAAGAQPGFVWGGAVNTGLSIPKNTFGTYWYHRGAFDEKGIEKEIEEFKKTGDLQALKYNARKELFKRTGDRKFLQRVPCMDDGEFMRGMLSTVSAAAGAKAKYNFDYYFVGDEGSLTSYTDPFDFCWDPNSLDQFRLWLDGEYSSLDALNAEWRSSFSDWESVVPYTTAEALETGNFAPWADHRTYMEVAFARAYSRVREAVRTGDADGHIAVSGTQVTKSYNGCDWYRLDSIIDHFLSYSGGNQWDLHRSFAKPHSMIGYWTGYGSQGTAVQNAIWTAAVHNVLYPNIFWMYCYLDPDFTYSKSARDMGVAFKELKFEGIAKLFMESERLHDGIAIHYSMPSAHAASITFNERERGRSKSELKRSFSGDRDGWVSAVKDSGLQFDFVSYDEVEKRALSSGEYKVFIMPFSMALSPEEVAAIKEFAEAGGVVIADAAAGLMNEHCSWRKTGLLDEFFGIQSAAPRKREYSGVTMPLRVTRLGEKWRLDAGALQGLEAAEAKLSVTTAKPLLMMGMTPLVMVRSVGKGRAVYLNILYDTYSRLRKKDFGGAAWRELTEKVLAGSGIDKTVQIVSAGKALEQAVVARYKIGRAQVVAVVKENVAVSGVEGADGVTVYDDERLGRVASQEITVRFPKAGYITDVRTGKSLGYGETVKTTIMIGGATVLAHSPIGNELTIEGPPAAARGERLEFAISSKDAARRVARCHFFAPDNSFATWYAQNVLLEGSTTTVTLPSALNDLAGQWRLVVTDLSTGATAEHAFKLE